MRLLIGTITVLAALAVGVIGRSAGEANACAGLIGSNGAVNLGRTTTLATYHDGVEHYITAFQFQGGGGEFGTLIPLPGVPTTVERGGGWTLQRLQQETQVARFEAASGVGGPGAADAEVLQEVRIDALDITVLKGGGPSVAKWATEHGFSLSPDAPEVLEFYASRSPIFLAAVFDAQAAADRGQAIGDGTPVSITIPTDNPWVPLRILGLGKQSEDFIQADVFLLTDDKPAFLPAPNNGMFLTHSQVATDLLLDDLRSDDGMGWIPESGFLTKLEISKSAGDLKYDLAVDTSGNGRPSRIAAGLEVPRFLPSTGSGQNGDSGIAEPVAWALVLAGVAALALFAVLTRARDER